MLTDAAATLLAAKLKTPLQIGQHLVRTFEAAHEVGAKPVDVDMIEAVLSRRIEVSIGIERGLWRPFGAVLRGEHTGVWIPTRRCYRPSAVAITGGAHAA